MTGGDTIFGKIIRKEIPAQIVYENESVLAFRDIAPQAPTHILIIPKKPLKDVASAGADDQQQLGALLVAAGEIAKQEKLESFRLVVNNGADAGQSVFHLHVHLLAGRPFSWPPG
jgi:histidine triad (HIT) family protein